MGRRRVVSSIVWWSYPTPPLDSGFRRSDGISRGSLCFHSNRSSRLAPAHQGRKIRSCDFIRRIRTEDTAMTRPGPSGGQAPRLAKSSTALHFSLSPRI